MNFYLLNQQARESLSARIRELEFELSTLPEGSLTCSGGRWIYKRNGERQYLSVDKRRFAEQLARKAFLKRLLSEYSRELAASEAYIKAFDKRSVKSSDDYLHSAEHLSLLGVSDLQSELVQWQTADYEKNMTYPEHLRYKTVNGQYVRSKSEALIFSGLHDNHIPFRYEPAVYIGQTKIYPDFVIRHPKTGKTYIWEHAGLLQNGKYRAGFIAKLELYMENGWYPGTNLIITSESEEFPFDFEKILELIRIYFL